MPSKHLFAVTLFAFVTYTPAAPAHAATDPAVAAAIAVDTCLKGIAASYDSIRGNISMSVDLEMPSKFTTTALPAKFCIQTDSSASLQSILRTTEGNLYGSDFLSVTKSDDTTVQYLTSYFATPIYRWIRTFLPATKQINELFYDHGVLASNTTYASDFNAPIQNRKILSANARKNFSFTNGQGAFSGYASAVGRGKMLAIVKSDENDGAFILTSVIATYRLQPLRYHENGAMPFENTFKLETDVALTLKRSIDLSTQSIPLKAGSKFEIPAPVVPEAYKAMAPYGFAWSVESLAFLGAL